jgi:TolB protein
MRGKVVQIALVGLIGFCVVSACTGLRSGIPDDDGDGGGLGDGGLQNVGNLQVTPSTAELTINGSAQSIPFRAVSDLLGDVTSQAQWSLSDGSIGSVSNGLVTISASIQTGGQYQVVATLGNGSAEATLNIRLVASNVIDPSAPPDANTWFTGPSTGDPPNVVYPFNNTMMAPNITQMGLQWSAGSGQTVFRIIVSGPTYERNFYVGSSLCPGGNCTYDVDNTTWSTLGHSSLGQPVTVVVAGVSAKGQPFGISPATNITFSPEDVKGGLYYFSPTIEGIKRVPLGATAPVDFITNGDGTGCAGCHAVSRDGSKVAVEFGSGETGVGSDVVDGANPSNRNFTLTSSISWNFSWFNPTGDKLITNWNGALTVRDPTNGQVLSTVQPSFINGAGASMPEWSPDGNWIAFVREPTSQVYDFEMNNCGDIMVMPYNGGSFGPAVELVQGTPNSEVHFWPTWSPDSQWLVFDTMTCSSGTCAQYNATTTRLRMIRAIDDTGQPTKGMTPIELTNGTHSPNNTNNWPKFAPFLQNNQYVFVVYSAKYNWGFNGMGNPQLFMFAIDLNAAKMTPAKDPSFQPIWLPFQDSTTGNHSAIWTTDVTCMSNSDCPGEFQCVSGSCVPLIG